MKKIILWTLVVALLTLAIPMTLGLVFGGREEPEADGDEDEADFTPVTPPETVKVWLEDEQEVRELDFEEYVACVVACEMPADFESEALKAQAVAARTYAVSKLSRWEDSGAEAGGASGSGASGFGAHPQAPLCDTTHCQVYRSQEELIRLHEDGWEKEGFAKVKEATEATRGQMLYYEGELVTQPLFFSSSGGQTENSEDVFVSAYPYLVSVESPYEDEATHTDEEKRFTLAEMKQALAGDFPDRPTGTLNADNIKIISRTEGGRVAQMTAGSATFKGTEIRTALGLSSALFSISFEGSGGEDTTTIVFTSDGSGHGVGMSQYGADGMAKAGSDYIQILTHYYTGTQVY